MRRALDALAVKLDGKAAAPATVTRKRSAFYSALEYAVELELFEANPIDKVQLTKPESTDIVDRRVVANPTQARALLAAVDEISPALMAFFGCLYYAGLRPSEAKHLVVTDCNLPEEGWGELLLTGSTQHAGSGWTDSGQASEDRSLKHRPDRATRPVPACPELVRLLRHHIAEFGPGPGGRLFVSRTGRGGHPLPPPYSNPVSSNTYSRVWQKAREKALGDAGAATPLAKRPYDLRHAAVSLWLNAGVPATQVAEWAGHSVSVLLKVYAKCLDGQDEVARRRVEAALNEGLTEEAA
jgi:integrase